ncbi:class I SAM-dependent RNA methyltransferase [Sphingomonas jatrophae]|uniref:23S rRNA m(5)U-1939 methyltransferase n=1 Tax=Sphingomonas jatrophae TaxID=1166337 RepID=A0A1I6JFB5_9SPHN|nr:class I SAM-dependent RNA methyltransferase [Sphingomonas jatrophae]SFR77300.1 23S rRNA m(5)U-1939 methyltransferase [Sphingomonas jatrophae]
MNILRLAARGDGVAEDGSHWPLTAPGDTIVDGVAVAGPHRIVPPCRHFPRCGGCQIQQVDDEAYRAFLVERVGGALASQRLSAEIRAPHLSPPNSRRRATLHAQRMGKAVLLGFREEKSHAIVDMRECHILAPALFALVAPLRQLLGQLLPSKGVASVSLTLADQGVDASIGPVRAEGLAAAEALTDFAQAHGLARLSLDEGYGAEPRWEPAGVTVTLGGVQVPLPVGAFLQATADGEAALVAGVREAVGDAATVADLFAGLGTFALALGGKVLAVEGARDAALALRTAAGRVQRPVLVEHRDLFRRPLDAKELGRFDAVVLDPPRAGAKEQMPALAASGIGRIAYVSCNPATFARDARTLVDAGWRLAWVRPVGQFRWSIHVELVAAFDRG